MNKFGVIIGQFQPFCNTHLTMVRFALERAEKIIIVLGSDSQAKTTRRPWSSAERLTMIRSCFTQQENDRISFVGAKDYLYNENLWITSVQERVNDIADNETDIVLVGRKDSSRYLNQFPQWKLLDTGDLAKDEVTASHVRDMYFTLDLIDIKRHVPETVFSILKSDMMKDALTQSPEFLSLKSEYEHVLDYKALWSKAPYPPTFVTVDAVVIKSGHVLVVRRRGQPGKGLIALPGGFINEQEQLIESCLRELKEETAIKLPKADILATLRDKEVFDHPERSLRGRTITHAFCFNLGQGELPKVKGEDDADKAWWMSLRDVMSSEASFFEDHFHIINHFVNKF